MVTTKDFCDNFVSNYLPSNLFFNQHNAICEIIDKGLNNPDYFKITVEDETEYTITYRCENRIDTCCTIIPVLASVVSKYNQFGWLVSYYDTGEMLFQTFIEVNKKTGVSKPVKI